MHAGIGLLHVSFHLTSHQRLVDSQKDRQGSHHAEEDNPLAEGGIPDGVGNHGPVAEGNLAVGDIPLVVGGTLAAFQMHNPEGGIDYLGK